MELYINNRCLHVHRSNIIYSLLMLIYRLFTRWIDYNVSHISILIHVQKNIYIQEFVNTVFDIQINPK